MPQKQWYYTNDNKYRRAVYARMVGSSVLHTLQSSCYTQT